MYFAEDLGRLVAACARGLRPGGRFVAPVLVSVDDAEPLDRIAPDATRLAVALRAAGLAFAVRDLTEVGHAVWERTAAELARLEETFRAEGSHDLWSGRQQETGHHLARYRAGRARRYLYVARR